LSNQVIKINCVVKISEEEKEAREVAAYCELNNLKIRFIREMDLEKGTFWRVKGGDGGNCSSCNRLRLSSNGKKKESLSLKAKKPFQYGAVPGKLPILSLKKAKMMNLSIGHFATFSVMLRCMSRSILSEFIQTFSSDGFSIGVF